MATTLARQLKEQNEAGRVGIPAATLAVMDQATAEVAASGIAGSSSGMGATAPDFDLPGATGTKVSLSALLAQGPVVLAFYRGGWCPYCLTELRALQAKLVEINAAGVTSMRAWGLFVSKCVKDPEPELCGEPGAFLVSSDGAIYMVALNSMPAARPRVEDLVGAIGLFVENDYPPRGEA